MLSKKQECISSRHIDNQWSVISKATKTSDRVCKLNYQNIEIEIRWFSLLGRKSLPIESTIGRRSKQGTTSTVTSLTIDHPKLTSHNSTEMKSKSVNHTDYSSVRKCRTHRDASKSKKHQCKVCDKQFAKAHYLKQHIRVHTGEKTYKCKVCEKSYRQNSALTVHSRTHTGEKPFVCKVCGKSFDRSNTLTAHNRIHTAERPFKCNQCDQTFVTSSHLCRHKKQTHLWQTMWLRSARKIIYNKLRSA